MPSALQRLRPPPRRQHGSRGAVALEAALVTPIFLLLLFGIIEFGFAFKDTLTVSSAVRAGVRAASSSNEPVNDCAAPVPTGFACRAAQQVANGLAALPGGDDVQEIWVYAAGPDGYPVGGDASFADCAQCAKFAGSGGTVTLLSDTWADVACPGEGEPPLAVGVYLQVDHPTISKFVLRSWTIREHAVLAFEPQAGPCLS